MPAKKKTLVILTSLLVVLVIAAVSVVAIWAATQVNVEGDMVVTFDTQEVSADVTIHSKISNGTSGNGTWTAVGSALSFNGSEITNSNDGTAKSSVKNFGTDLKKLSSDTPYYILRFEIKNTSSAVPITASLAYNDRTYTVDQNTATFKEETADDTGTVLVMMYKTVAGAVAADDYAEPNWTNNGLTGSVTDESTQITEYNSSNSVTIPVNSTVCAYVVVAVKDFSNAGKMSGKLNWTLKKA